MEKVIITVTCDWDGLDYPLDKSYNPDNTPNFRFIQGLKAVRHFNEIFDGKIPITHFICPVYFSRSKSLTACYAKAISHLIGENRCEVGLHIHCWISLMQACGVSLKDPVKDSTIPDWGATAENRYGLCVPYCSDEGDETIDYGHGTPLGVYHDEAIGEILTRARMLLVENKILQSPSHCVSFRCGGWMANDAVMAALREVEIPFQYEASAVDASFFATSNGVLDAWLAQLWGAQRQVEIPYLSNHRFLSAYPNGMNIYGNSNDVTEAQPRRIQQLLELPDTAILADYVEATYMKAQIDQAIELASKRKSEVYLSLGFHLESGGDARFGRRFGHIEKVIEVLQSANEQYGNAGKILYLTIAEAGTRFMRTE